MTDKLRRMNVDEIVPGMKVEATQGDLGEQDVSPAQVTEVQQNQEGNVETLKVSKGTLFRKQLNVPADRVEAVDPAAAGNGSSGKVIIDAREEELEALTKAGPQTLPPERESAQDSLLDQVEQQAPTAEGMREKERNISATRPRSTFWRVIGPGFLAGTSGNDPSAVTAYAVDGANAGYGHLWLMLLTTPLYQAVQFACAKIGRVSHKGLSQLLREHYGHPVAIAASLLLITTNVALIAADLAAIGSGFELITSIIAPLLVIAILLVGNNRKIMQENRLSLLNNFGLLLIALILVVGAGLLFYGLATGQGC